MGGVPGAFRIMSTRRLLDGARGSPLDDGVGAAATMRPGLAQRGATRAERRENQRYPSAQETKLRLGVALFPDRLLDTPRDNTKG